MIERAMSLPTLNGPHALSQRIVEQTIRRKVAGVYALSAKEGGVIALRRVGRADTDLAAALLEKEGKPLQSQGHQAQRQETPVELRLDRTSRAPTSVCSGLQ